MQDKRPLPNERMEQRKDELDAITRDSIEVVYEGDIVYSLHADRGEFRRETFRALRDHDYQINRQRDEALHVEKHPDGRRHR